MQEKYYIGVDLGGTNIKAGMVTRKPKIIVKTSIPTEADQGPEHVLKRICSAIETVRKRSGLNKDDIAGVGIGAPGTLSIKDGVVTYPPNLPGWRNVPVVEYVERETGLCIRLENDANAAAYAEYWVGAGQGANPLVMLTLGTGIGCGIMIDGEIVHGCTDSAGEFGHIVIEVNGRKCACGNWGCLEAYASANSLVRRFVEAVKEGEDSTLAEKVNAGEEVNSQMIEEAARAGDALSARIFRETGVYLGVGIVNMLHTLNPSRILLAGGLALADDLIMDPVVETVEKRALPDPWRGCSIKFAELGEDAGLIGAAGCALNAFGTSQ